MSRVTDIILVVALGDEENAETVLDHLVENYGGSGYADLAEEGGGDKCVQCCAYIGAVNYLVKDELLEVFRAVDWEYPEWAQLMLKGEEETVFQSYFRRGCGNEPEIDPALDVLPALRKLDSIDLQVGQIFAGLFDERNARAVMREIARAAMEASTILRSRVTADDIIKAVKGSGS